jgi:hypothetical protein
MTGERSIRLDHVSKIFITRGKSFKALASHTGSSSIDKRADQAQRMIWRTRRSMST